MFPNLMNNEPPQAVKELVDEYKNDREHRELVIEGGYFLLYELNTTKEEDQPDTVSLGKFIKRAYWESAGFMSQEMIRSRLGLR